MAKLQLADFVSLGYLQEVNRLFFHPLGLALAITHDGSTDRPVCLGPILDHRSDPDGIAFSFLTEELPDAKRLADFVESERKKREPGRIKILGSPIEPVE